jgi:magnesium-transporting ATPase (P-type)
MIRSDLVLLASSAPDGTAFLETMNLDGETNLKLREALEATHEDLTKKGVGSDGNAGMPSPLLLPTRSLLPE